MNVRESRRLNGSDYYSDTNAHAGLWKEIYACEDSVAALVSSDMSGTLSAVNLTAGTSIEGTFTSITLASGSVVAYR